VGTEASTSQLALPHCQPKSATRSGQQLSAAPHQSQTLPQSDITPPQPLLALGAPPAL
ncbi:unnamed protein product, partial [Polarella glacialis]